MKKILALSVLFPLTTMAMLFNGNISGQTNVDTTSAGMSSSVKLKRLPPVCMQVIQPAINANGECKEFATPCDVPNDWKKVDACANFAIEEKSAKKLSDIVNRRLNNRWKKLREKAKNTVKTKGAQTAREHKFLLRSHRFIKQNFNRLIQKYDKVRGFSDKKWNSKFKKYLTPLQKKARLEKEKINKLKKESLQKNLYRRPSGTASLTKKLNPAAKKKLSGKFWSVAQKNREKRFKRIGGNSEVIKKALRSRQPFRKAKKKHVSNYKGLKLKKLYKGARLRGSLEGEIK